MKKKQRGEVMARKLLILLILISCVAIGASGDTEVPNTFVSGETASAAEVNENFEALADAVDAAQYTGQGPVDVNGAAETIGLNVASRPEDVLTWDGTNWVASPPHGWTTQFDNMQPFQALNYVIALVGIYPSRTGMEAFVGEITIFAGNFPPRGWALCDGQLLTISQNEALFSLVGTMYGGDGRTTFGLPDLRGRAPIHAGSGPGLRTYQQGQRGGSETITP